MNATCPFCRRHIDDRVTDEERAQGRRGMNRDSPTDPSAVSIDVAPEEEDAGYSRPLTSSSTTQPTPSAPTMTTASSGGSNSNTQTQQPRTPDLLHL